MSRLRLSLSLVVVLFLLIAIGFAADASTSSAKSAASASNGVGSSAAPVVSSFRVSPTLAAPGQFVNFSWASANATAFNVVPEIAQDDQTLPPTAPVYSYNTNGLARTTIFQAIAGSISSASMPMATTLTIVPVTLSASSRIIAAGRSVTLSYSGPNNNSTWVLNTSNSDIPIPLPHGCSGITCSGTYQTGPLAAATTFTVSLAGPAPTGGQAYSPRVVVNVQQPTRLTLKALTPVARAGDAVTLSWTAANASAITIDGVGQLQPVGGGTYCCVHPTKTTTYTASATPIYPGAPSVRAASTVTVSTGDLTNLNHIIFLVQENRSFDNYFGQLAEYRVNHQPPIQGAMLSDVNDLHVLPPDFTLCNLNNLCFPLYHARTMCTENISPAWDESHYDMHLSDWDWLNVNQNSTFLMDLFLDVNWVNGLGGKWDTQHTRPLGYYDQMDLPFYYELATQFTTDDAWYSPIAANTVPNRMYLFSGTSYGHAFAPASQNDPAWQQETIFRALTAAGIRWRYYYQDNSVFLSQWADWNDPNISGNVRSIQEYYTYLADPNADKLLPQVVFIERATQIELDEHPLNNVQTGAAAVTNMLTALFNSTAWPDSAFILTYDEGGGLYDHAPPILVTPPDNFSEPTDLQNGDIQAHFNTTGFRVPNVVISPWSRPQTVIHLATDYTSILKLIEERFNVPALTQRDATTQDMADPVSGFFDFSFPHLLQVPPLPTQPTNGVCDQTLGGYKMVQIYGQQEARH
jgi:phospholipase C